MRRSRRDPTRAELELWGKVVKDVAPLAGRAAPSAAEPAPETPVAPAATPQASPSALSARVQPRPPALPALAPLETRFRRRLARGVVAIDARIDLHGLRQEDAHRRLSSFLAGAQARGHKLVLVITGKGAPGADPFAERGVLRRAVPLWLAAETARGVVVGFEPADPVHGGAGALYVRIRRPR
ncbi:Smr/MutS family protein [Hansschlegelia sp. KR7-227]|uniref:Smr/MutS family protein n=1 Tax=Hansschlegelia sp. KR7-227 TaxID=3400914 RepID=UPI003C04EEF6